MPIIWWRLAWHLAITKWLKAPTDNKLGIQRTPEAKSSMTNSLQIDFSNQCEIFLDFLDNTDIAIENLVQSNYNDNPNHNNKELVTLTSPFFIDLASSSSYIIKCLCTYFTLACKTIQCVRSSKLIAGEWGTCHPK